MKQFIVKLTGLTLATAAIGALIFVFLLPEHYLPFFPFLLAFFYVFTLVSHRILYKMAGKTPGLFIQSSMVLTVIRLVLYSIIAMIYIVVDRENAIPFAIGLAALYLIFTTFEVVEICKIADCKKRKQNRIPKEPETTNER